VPGDILSSREIRDSERRLRMAQIFHDPATGQPPRIALGTPRLGEDETEFANRERTPSTPRGQSPDPPSENRGRWREASVSPQGQVPSMPFGRVP
jgi:hypothetical protein